MHRLILCAMCVLFPAAALAQDPDTERDRSRNDEFLTSSFSLMGEATSWLGGTSTDNADLFSSSTQHAATGLLSVGILTSLGSVVTTSTFVLQASRAATLITMQEGELRRAAALGAGPVVDDLAVWMALTTPHARRRLGLLLRRERAAILAAIDQPTPMERGWALLHVLHAIEAELRRDLPLTRRP